ncbi:MAG TPA: hypothetical protein DD414_09715 [Lachnospiraceae bacterium]|nr:hypothetical protein [Lachnospiraceae bacterium]
MTRKRIFALGLAGCILSAGGIGVTAVSFMRQEEEAVAVLAEPVQLELCLLTSGERYEEDQVTGILPGESVKREPAVILDADSPEAYIRVRFAFGGILGPDEDESESEREERLEKIRQLQDGIRLCRGWIMGEDDTCYYKERVAPGSIIPVYDQVTIPEDWDNHIAEKIFTIVLSAEAVRADSLDPWMGEGEAFYFW